MTSLLHIAARLEAAVESYAAVRDLTDGAEWKRHFEEEKVSSQLNCSFTSSPFELGPRNEGIPEGQGKFWGFAGATSNSSCPLLGSGRRSGFHGDRQEPSPPPQARIFQARC